MSHDDLQQYSLRMKKDEGRRRRRKRRKIDNSSFSQLLIILFLIVSVSPHTRTTATKPAAEQVMQAKLYSCLKL